MRDFVLTRLNAPLVRSGGSPDVPDGVIWPALGWRWVGDLEELEKLLTTPVWAAGKFACPFFLCGRFRENHRSNATFEAASIVALDVEKGPTTREAHETFKTYRHLIYTTWSHRLEAPRFRLVLPLARDVDAKEYKLLWMILAKRLGVGADPQTKDLARALFFPAIRPDGRKASAKAWTEVPLLEPDALLIEALKLITPKPSRRPLPPVSVPDFAARKEAQLRLNTDTETRRRAGEWLQGQVRGNRVEGVNCPQCGRPSVWFWIEPGRMKTAACNHKNSCGWWGHLDGLLDAAGSLG